VIWIEGANPWYLVVLLTATVAVLLVTLWIERRPADPWDDLLKQERGRR
jgi:hypothetical protein